MVIGLILGGSVLKLNLLYVGYERYRIVSNKSNIEEGEICDFNGSYGNILSVLLSKVTGKKISVELIKESFENISIIKSSSFNNKIDFSVLQEQILFDEEIYIDNIWCHYYLSYYSVKNKFVEKMYFGCEEYNNFVNLQTYE